MVKMHQARFAYSATPDPLARFKGAYSKGKGRVKEEKGRMGKGREKGMRGEGVGK